MYMYMYVYIYYSFLGLKQKDYIIMYHDVKANC